MNTYVIIGEGQREGEERVLGVYTDQQIAKVDFKRVKKEGYGDWEDFRLETHIANTPFFEFDDE